MTQLEKAIRKTIHTCLKLKPEEPLMILIDEPHRELGYIILKTALRVSNQSFLIEIKQLHKLHQEPPATIEQLMKQMKAIIVATSVSLYHSKAVRTACHHGARILCLSQLTLEIIARSINTDFDFIEEKSNRLADLFSIGKSVQLTTPAGTNISTSISRRKGVANTGLVQEAGMIAALPSGEAWIQPENEKTEGVIVIDGSLGVFGMVKNPIELNIKNGYIKKIIGDHEAEYLRKMLKSYGRQARFLAELGVGTNPKAKITGQSIEDEKALGTVHFVFGDAGYERGNDQHQYHINAILKNPTLKIDGRLIVESGELKV